MNLEFNYDKTVQRIIDRATDEVKERKSTRITDEFLLFSLYKDTQYQTMGKCLSLHDFNLFTLRYYVDNRNSTLEEPDFAPTKEVVLSPQSEETFMMAAEYAEMTGYKRILVPHLLMALLESDNRAITDYYRDYKIPLSAIRKDCVEFIYTGKIKNTVRDSVNTKQENKDLDKVIEETCTDLTALALNGQIDPIIGREKEIDAIINTMARRSKNNVLIAAPEGVGKTAIVKGLALKLANNEIPSLANKRIFSLSIGSLMSNSMYRGQLEEKVTNLIKALSDLGNAILFIDELHMICKSGQGKDSSIDIAGLLKTELANRSLQLIGCTTLRELRILQEDPAFLRRLNVIKLDEPDEDEAFKILKGLAYKYEDFHNVALPDDTLKCAIKLAKRYVAERYLPDSAIDVIDSASAKLKLSQTAFNNEENKQELELSLLENKMNETKNGKECIKLYQRMQTLKNLLSKEIEPDIPAVRVPLTEDHIAAEIEIRTGIPTSRLMASEKAKLLQLEDDLHERVIGQDLAIEEISSAIRRSCSGLSNPDKPVASFLFAGPTGVGKTELCKALAELRYGSRESMIRIDCSEFSESHSVSKLIGAAPGYIGYDKGGQLTEAVRNKPFSLILFDEFEKAKGNLTNILLQILDDGRLTDSNGVTVSFKNCIIVLTTNLGSGLLAESRAVGFGTNDATTEEANEYEQLKEKTMNTIKKALSPEFLNRLSATVVFHPLNKEQQRQIIRLLGKRIDERLEEQNIIAKCSDEALDFIADQGYSKEYGARPLERALIKYIEEPLSLLLLEDKILPGDYVQIELDGDKLKFTVVDKVEA
jgi:ATP-dependent Clp protease ATP-binding subunit ClpC